MTQPTAAPRAVAVTGAAGNLGRLVVERLLLARGIERVVALDVVPPADRPPPDLAGAKPRARLEPVAADVRDPGFGAHLEGCCALVHLAFVVETDTRDAVRVEAINIGGTHNVVTAALAAGVERIVYASSIAAYGFHPENRGRLLTEDDPIRGTDSFYYSRHKAALERWLDGVEADHPAARIVRLRPTIFVGPRSTRGMARGLQGRLFLYLAGAPIPIHLTHEDDVADAFVLAVTHPEARGAYNVATDRPLPSRSWGRAMGKPSLRLPEATVDVIAGLYRAGVGRVDPIWLRAGRRWPIAVSPARIKRELGWRPAHPTTADALRAIGGDPTARASRGTRLLFGSMARITRLLGALPAGHRERAEARALTGALNLVLTGPTASAWHMRFDDGQTGFHRGLAPRPVATTTLKEAVFFDLLAGKTSFSVAQMTGKVRFRGAGEMSLVLGALVERFKKMGQARGARGLPLRVFHRAVLAGGPRAGRDR